MSPPRRLLNRDFVLLWQGQFVSQLGTQAFLVAMVFWLKRQTESATLIGLASMATTLPAVLLGPIGGTFADRHSRRAIIVLGDFLRGAVSIALAVLTFTYPDRPQLILVFLLGTALFNGVTGSFFRPAISAAIPDLVPEERVASANSLNRIALDVASFLGLGVGGVLFRVLGPGLIFLFNGLSFVFSGVSECFIRIPQQIPETGGGWRAALADFRRDLVGGLRFVWESRGMRWVLFLSPLENFFVTAIVVLFPFYVEDVLGVRPDWYGYLAAAFGGGSAVGSLLAGATTLPGGLRRNVILAFSMAFALAAAALGLATSPWLALGLLFVSGLMNGFSLIHFLSLIQLTTPSHLRGRVLGLFETLAISMTPLAAGLTGVVADLLSRDIPLIYMGCGGALVLVTLALAASRDARAFLAWEPAPSSPAVET